MNFLSRNKPGLCVSSADIFTHENALGGALKELPVTLVFLHGSVAHDAFKPLSDIDIAVLFKPGYELRDISAVREAITDIIGREEVDLAVLNRASPLFCMSVLRGGKVLYCCDKSDLAAFRASVIRRYLSTNHLRKRFFTDLTRAVLGGTHVPAG